MDEPTDISSTTERDRTALEIETPTEEEIKIGPPQTLEKSSQEDAALPRTSLSRTGRRVAISVFGLFFLSAAILFITPRGGPFHNTIVDEVAALFRWLARLILAVFGLWVLFRPSQLPADDENEERNEEHWEACRHGRHA